MNSTKISQPIKVGIRRSKLAIVQAEIVLARLRSHNPELQFELIYVTNPGDKIRDRPIAEVGESGVFVKELENALLAKTVAIVVHSLKDLPTEMPKDLALAAVSDREDPRDVLISHKQLKFSQLPKDATVATSSRRRSAQLLAQRKDLKFIDIRGNVPTRLKKHDDGQCNAIILAAAGLIRLGLAERITEFLPIDICLPAAGQGVLGCQCRKDDTAIYQLLSKINDPKVEAEVVAERTFLQELGGGCSVPIGCSRTLQRKCPLVIWLRRIIRWQTNY